MDYKDEEKEEEEYIQLYIDYGWEYLVNYSGYYYFRKKNVGLEEVSIFSDNQSRMEMCKKVLKKQKFIIVIAAPAIIIYFFTSTQLWGSNDVLKIIFNSIVIVAYLFAAILHVRNFIKINRMISSYEGR